LELENGEFVAQSSAIDRYLSVVTGAEPANELAWARSDEVYAFMEDVFQTLAPTFKIKDEAEKLKARKEACEGPLKEKLATLDAHLAKLGDGAWFSGLDRPSYADYSVWNWLCVLKSGSGRASGSSARPPY
jgi:glutathione S-transferase